MVVGVLLGDNIFPKRRNWLSGTNYIFLPSHFCICLEMQRRIAIVAIWNNCDRSVLSVLFVPAHQNRTHKIMHHVFKTWCIVSMSGGFAKSVTVVDTISTTVIFYFPPSEEWFLRKAGLFPNISVHRHNVHPDLQRPWRVSPELSKTAIVIRVETINYYFLYRNPPKAECYSEPWTGFRLLPWDRKDKKDSQMAW